MIFICLVAIASAIALFQFGAMSVWVSLLATAVKVLLAILAIGALALLWKRFFRSKA